MNIKHVPNILSIIRLALVPIFIALYVKGHVAVAVMVFLTAGATDVLDGFIARKYNCTSTLGKVLDPLADKLMQLSAFVCLYASQLVPLWMPLVYFLKEFLTIVGAFFVFKKENFVVKSNVFGKAATVLVFAAVCIIAVFGETLSDTTITIICAVTCLYFVFSCLMYAKYVFDSFLKKYSKELVSAPNDAENPAKN